MPVQNPAAFSADFDFEVTFECSAPLAADGAGGPATKAPTDLPDQQSAEIDLSGTNFAKLAPPRIAEQEAIEVAASTASNGAQDGQAALLAPRVPAESRLGDQFPEELPGLAVPLGEDRPSPAPDRLPPSPRPERLAGGGVVIAPILRGALLVVPGLVVEPGARPPAGNAQRDPLNELAHRLVEGALLRLRSFFRAGLEGWECAHGRLSTDGDDSQ